jgi:hypothetical protein
MMTFDPEQNRIQMGLLTADERAALKDVKQGWQRFLYNKKVWVETSTPVWDPDGIYRAKPAPAPTIIVNGIEVPEPVREELEVGRKYWLATTSGPELSIELIWRDHPFHRTRLNRGLIHLTEAAAVEHTKAMIAPSMREDV